MKIVESKNIELNVRRNLIKVDPITRTATFEILDDDAVSTGKTVSFKVYFFKFCSIKIQRTIGLKKSARFQRYPFFSVLVICY